MDSEVGKIVRIPSNAGEALLSALVPGEYPKNTDVQVVITLGTDMIVARDMSGYLELLDHVYGRMDPDGLSSYAHKKYGHLTIDEVKAGSLELIFIEAFMNAQRLCIIYLIVKYLPVFLRELASMYRDFEEGRLARVRRKQIEREMKQDENLKTLSTWHRTQLVKLVDELLLMERDNLPRAQRLARGHLKDVRIQIVDKEVCINKEEMLIDE